MTQVAATELGHGYPQFLPDGQRFLYFVASSNPDVQGVYASSLANPTARQLIVRTAAKAVYVPPRGTHQGYLLWMQDETLLAQRFDADSLARDGDPVSVAENVGLNPGVAIRAAYWASDAGLLIYFAAAQGLKRPVMWIGRDGKPLGDAVSEEDVLTPALSPDAQRVAMTRRVNQGTGRNVDIWVRDLVRLTTTRLTFDAGVDNMPVWSPDGAHLAFASDRENGFQIYRKDASGAGQDERLTEGPNPKMPLDWSRDGRYLLYRESAQANDLMAIPLEGDRKPLDVVRTPFSESNGRISPDGSWIAYTANDTGQFELYVQAFPGARDKALPSGKWQILEDRRLGHQMARRRP